jgi:hypothetical protein
VFEGEQYGLMKMKINKYAVPIYSKPNIIFNLAIFI